MAAAALTGQTSPAAAGPTCSAGPRSPDLERCAGPAALAWSGAVPLRPAPPSLPGQLAPSLADNSAGPAGATPIRTTVTPIPVPDPGPGPVEAPDGNTEGDNGAAGAVETGDDSPLSAGRPAAVNYPEIDETVPDTRPTGDPSATRATAALERLLLDGRDSDDNEFVIGTSFSAGPSYSGASDTTYAVRPAARLTWRGYSISTQSVARASARVESTRGGERTGISGPLNVRNRFAYGFGASINRGRDVTSEGTTIGLKSLPSTIYGRLRLRYTIDDRTTISATLLADILNRQQNMELPISIGRRYTLSDRMIFGLDAAVNFVNRRSMDNDYGINPEQSAASGKPVYRPGAGLREVAVSATLVHEPDRHWIWMTQFSLVRLLGDAAASPLVRQKLQPSLMIGLAYRINWD